MQQGPEIFQRMRPSGPVARSQGPHPLGQRALVLRNGTQPGLQWVSQKVCLPTGVTHFI